MATSSLPSTVAFDWRPPPTRVRLCRWLLTKLGQRLVVFGSLGSGLQILILNASAKPQVHFNNELAYQRGAPDEVGFVPFPAGRQA